MKINRKDSPSKTTGSNNKQFKSSKKSKGAKKVTEKELHSVLNSPETILKQKDKKIHENNRQAPISESDNVKTSLKPPQLEKRKQDGTEWKALKKVDYQRLETVLEEGQLSCEETSSEHNYGESEKSVSKSCTESCAEDAFSNTDHLKTKKPGFNNFMPFSEHSEVMEGEESVQPEAQIPYQHSPKQYRMYQKKPEQQFMKTQQNNEKEEKIVMKDCHGEPADSKSKELSDKFAQAKSSIILNGMVEILPIFSNNKFVCSRDAISVEECEEPELLDKNMSISRETLFESKSAKYTGPMDLKPFISSNSIKNRYNNPIVENPKDGKEMSERKFRYKILADKNFIRKPSSPFINCLLILTSFADERKRLLENAAISFKENSPAEVRSIQEDIESNQKSLLLLFYRKGTTNQVLSLLGISVLLVLSEYEKVKAVDAMAVNYNKISFITTYYYLSQQNDRQEMILLHSLRHCIDVKAYLEN